MAFSVFSRGAARLCGVASRNTTGRCVSTASLYNDDNFMAPVWEQRDTMRRIMKCKTAEQTRPLLESVIASGAPLGTKNGTTLMRTVGRLGDRDLSASLYAHLEGSEEMEFDLFALTAAVDMHGRAGDGEGAMAVFDKRKELSTAADAHAYNTAIRHAPSVAAAQKLCADMKADGLPLDVTTYQHAIAVCAAHGDPVAEELLDEMTALEIWPTAPIYDSLVSLYRTRDQPQLVIDAVNGMLELGLRPSRQSFHVLMGVHAEAGALEAAEGARDQMCKIHPEKQDTYAVLMQAAEQAEAWERALFYFEVLGRRAKPDAEAVKRAYRILHQEKLGITAADKDQLAFSLGLRADLVQAVYGVAV